MKQCSVCLVLRRDSLAPETMSMDQQDPWDVPIQAKVQ